MYFRSLILVLALTTVYAVFDHSPKFSAPHFKPYYLNNPYESKYDTYGSKHDDKYNKYDEKDSHYEPTYYANYNQDPSYYNSYEPKHGSYGHGKDYYSSYTPSYTPYYGSYYNEPKHNDYHGKPY